MKVDLAIYTHVLGVPGKYESVALMLSHKMDFNCCANRDGFRKSSRKIILRNKLFRYTSNDDGYYYQSTDHVISSKATIFVFITSLKLIKYIVALFLQSLSCH